MKTEALTILNLQMRQAEELKQQKGRKVVLNCTKRLPRGMRQTRKESPESAKYEADGLNM